MTLKRLHFTEGSFLTIDRAHIGFGEMERMTGEKVWYVAKMKKTRIENKIKRLGA